MANIAFEERAVAFIDVLGFSQLVEEAAKDAFNLYASGDLTLNWRS